MRKVVNGNIIRFFKTPLGQILKIIVNKKTHEVTVLRWDGRGKDGRSKWVEEGFEELMEYDIASL